MIKFFIALLIASTTLLVAFFSFAGLSDLKNSPKEIKKEDRDTDEDNDNPPPFIESDLESEKNKIVIDARGEDRFFAKVKEPRAGIKSGHIPSSLNIPISSIIDKNTNCLKSIDEINEIFTTLGLTDKNSELVMTCGSGVTACGLALAANSLGFKNVKVYDGSWSEWGSREETPIEI